MMSNPNDQGIPDDSKDMTMMLTIMALFNEQQKNDISIRRDRETIINDIMTRTRKSLSSSTSNITPFRDDDPSLKSSSSPGKRVSRSSSATDRSRRHDCGTSIQGQRTSHTSNKNQQASIESCSHRRLTGFHESARTRNMGSSFNSSSTRYKSLSVSWSDRISVTIVEMDKSPSKSTASACQMYGRKDEETATVPLVFPPLPFAVGPSDDTRETRTSGASISLGGAHSTSSMFDVVKIPTKSTTSTCQMYWQKNDRTTTGPIVFPPLPLAVGPSDDTRETRTSCASISPGGAHSTSGSSSSGNKEKGIYNEGDRIGEDPKEEEDQKEVAPTQKTTAQSYSKHLSSLIKTSTSPRKSSFLPGYSLGQLPKHRRHMVIPTTREAGVEYASTLQQLDFAFVLRSDGHWTYGIVCDVIGPNGEGDIVGVGPQRNPQSIRFAFDFHGSNKTIHKKNWGHKIRLINEDHEQSIVVATMA